jgi:hypothetical protein
LEQGGLPRIPHSHLEESVGGYAFGCRSKCRQTANELYERGGMSAFMIPFTWLVGLALFGLVVLSAVGIAVLVFWLTKQDDYSED